MKGRHLTQEQVDAIAADAETKRVHDVALKHSVSVGTVYKARRSVRLAAERNARLRPGVGIVRYEARAVLTPAACQLAEEIATVVNDAIGRADSAKIAGAVNWSNLMCVSVGFDTDGTVIALVSEASPDADALCTYLYGELRAAGIEHASVRTEW